jgi:ATP-dependent DNA ligase
VAKPLRSAYKAGRVWAKVTHAGTVDVIVVGSTGNARHPKALAVRLPDHRNALPQRLTAPLAAAIAPRLVPCPRDFPKAGDSCAPPEVRLC